MPVGRLVPNHAFVIPLLLALFEGLKLALHDRSSCNGDIFLREFCSCCTGPRAPLHVIAREVPIPCRTLTGCECCMLMPVFLVRMCQHQLSNSNRLT